MVMFPRRIRMLHIAINEHGPLKFCVIIFMDRLSVPKDISLRYHTSADDRVVGFR